MELERLQDLSVIYWLKNKFSAYPFVQIIDGYPEGKLINPAVAVEWDVVEDFVNEMGTREWLHERLWNIDIYAKTRSQRDEFTYKILNDLKETIAVNDYNLGFPPEVSPTKIGGLIPVRKVAKNIRINPTLVDELYYRATINYVATYDLKR